MPASVTRTLRVDGKLDKAVAARAAQEGVSVNFLVNSALRKLVEWDIPSYNVGLVTVSSALLKLLTEKQGEMEMREHGRRMARDFLRPAAEYLFGRFSLDSAIGMLRLASKYSGRISFDFIAGSDSRKSVLLIKHDWGRKWSSHYRGLMEETFTVLLGYAGKSTYTDTLCIMQLDLPNLAPQVVARSS